MKEIVWKSVLKTLSIKRLANAVQVLISLGLSRILGKSINYGVPFILNIEPTVKCNLACPQCLTGSGKTRRNESFLDFALYNQIIDELGGKIWYLLLYNQGEPFLHQNFIGLIKKAKSKNIYVTTSTNGHFFSDEIFVKEFIKSGIDSVFISLDGADQQTYEKYRSHGNFSKVITGIKQLVQIRQELESRSPLIFIQFLVMKHNEHQIGEIKKLVNKLGVDRLLFKTVQVDSKAAAQRFLPKNNSYSRYPGKTNNLNRAKQINFCPRLWYSSVLLSDGRVVPCCFDKNGDYALGILNNSTTFKQIWKSNEYRKFRNKIIKKANNISICQNCSQNKKVFI